MRYLISFVALIALASPILAQGEAIHKTLTEPQAEEFLKKLGIEFKKLDSKTAGAAMYDYQRKGFAIRFYVFDGKDVMLDTVFARLPLERVNEWNKKAKFSRASLQKDGAKEFVALEANLDLVGGVTEGGFRQFVSNFDDDVKLFARFAVDLSNDDRLIPTVTGDRLETVLKSIGVAFEKSTGKNGETSYDYEFDSRKVRLINFAGKDLMIDALFKKLSLEDINRYNLDKKFIRVGFQSAKGKEYTALECNLDCEVGTTDGILRSFLLGFHEDVKNFAKYVESK